MKNNSTPMRGAVPVPHPSSLIPHPLSIAPSILSADFARLGAEVKAVEEAGADVIHVDVMDGMFVPNITIGPVVVQKLRATTRLPFDVHLMIEDPGRYVDEFVKAGADVVTVHAEACRHLHRTLQQIKEASARHAKSATGRTFDAIVAGVAINPHTPLCGVKNILEDAGLVLIMTVNPGFGGQKFMTSCVSKLNDLSEIIRKRGLPTIIEVDGGVNAENAKTVASAGAHWLVAGAAVFGTSDYADAIRRIRSAASSKTS